MLLKIRILIVVLLITFFSGLINLEVFANDGQALQLESLTIEGFVLNPLFESHRYNYRIEMNEAVELKINAVPKDPNAEVKISGFEKNELSPGENIITITISRAGNEQIYEVTAFLVNEQVFAYTGNFQTYVIPASGTYNIQLWGAQGGRGRTNWTLNHHGAKGAYASGESHFNQGDVLYFYVGGVGGQSGAAGRCTGAAGGFNGGGRGGNDSNCDSQPEPGAGGGGATDVRLVSGTWNNFESLKSRIMIAAGGAGATYCAAPGHGGTLEGLLGNHANSRGGTQTTGYAFGYGGVGYAYTSGGGGGGGGYYGGSVGNADCITGGGGSSFVSGCVGCNAVGADAISTNRMHTGQPNHYSGIVFDDIRMFAGSQTMPSKDNLSTMVGSTSHGYARISLVRADPSDKTLSDLYVVGGELVQNFNANRVEYDIVLQPDQIEITLYATPNDPDALLKGDISKPLTVPVGTHEFIFTVVSPNNSEKNYRVYTHREPSSYRYLDNILFNGRGIEAFNPTQLNYDINLPFDVDRNITLDWIKGRPDQLVIAASEMLMVKNQPISILVISEDGSLSSEYTITPRIADSNLLRILDLGLEDVTLDDFNPETYTYDVQVPLATSTFNLTALPFDEEAQISVMGGGYLRVGNNTVKIMVHHPRLESKEYTLNINRSDARDEDEGKEYDFTYKGNVQEFVAPFTGYYLVELWGAQGGRGRQNNRFVHPGGFGSYTKGQILLEKDTKIYIYVGGAGADSPSSSRGGAGGFNGGGTGGNDPRDDEGTGGGGGATDIRLSPGSWNSFDSLKSRIMVAAGGGGSTFGGRGGHGGTITSDAIHYSAGATQQLGGFGVGQNGTPYLYTPSSGAGSGYRGGFSKHSGNSSGNQSASGGSSFVSGCDGCDAISAESTASDIIHTDQPDHYSGYVFSEIEMHAGHETMPGKNGGYTSGNSGHGHARITALRRPSTDNHLQRIELNQGAQLNPSFDLEIPDYDLILDPEHVELSIKGVPVDSFAQVQGNGSFIIEPGEHVHTLSVTAEDGNVKDYVINISREASTNATPQDIVITGLVPSLCEMHEDYCHLDPVFHVENDGSTYKLIVPARIRTLELNVIKGHLMQAVEGDGVIELNPGDNQVAITITSEDKNHSRTYNYVIERNMEGNADLSALEVREPEREIHFNPDITEYYLSVPFEIDHSDAMEFYYEALDKEAVVTFENEGPFELGMNELIIRVTANNGASKTYRLYIYRERSSNTFLKYLKVYDEAQLNELSMSPSFDKTLHQYLINVEHETARVYIETEAEEASTNISMSPDGVYDLKVGNNEINILVTADDGTFDHYRLNVIRKPSSNKEIASITLNGELLEDFDPSQLKQSFDVDSQLLKPKYEIELADKQAKFSLSGATQNFVVGTNTLNIKVVAEDGSSHIYSLDFIKPASTNNKLKELTSNLFDIRDYFDPDENEYFINLDYTEEALVLSGVPEHETSHVLGMGKYYLSPGDNTIEIEVISESKASNFYILNINRAVSNNAKLKSITSNQGLLTPDFNPDTLNYEIKVVAKVESISVVGLPQVATTLVAGNQTYPLVTGFNTIELITQAESGASLTYTIVVEKAISDDADLKSLVVLEGALRPAFDANVTNYNISVAHDVGALTILAAPSDSKASVEISEHASALESGVNEVEVKVIAESGLEKIYYLNVLVNEPPSENVDLESLVINPGALSPSFSPTHDFYQVVVDYEASQISVLAQSVEGQVISGNGNHSLVVGENMIVVSVQAENGVIKDYQLEVERLPSSDASLKSLLLNNIEDTYLFRPTTYAYDVSTRHQALDIKAIPNHPHATVEIINNENFITHQSQDVVIRVIAQDQVSTQDYVVSVNKLVSRNNNLASLTIQGVTLEPQFSPNTTIYSGVVAYDVQQINIEAIAQDPNAWVDYEPNQMVNIGLNYVDISVNPEDSSSPNKTYTILLIREGSPNNKLSSLMVDGVVLEGFDPEVYDYTISDPYPYEKASVYITYQKSDQQAMVMGAGTRQLESGTHTLEVSVLAQNGDVLVYRIHYERDLINSPRIKHLQINQYELASPFDPDQETYSLVINNETTQLQLDIELEDEFASYNIEGNEQLSVGNNDVKINVTSSGGDLEKTYTLNVYKQAYANNFLAYLQPSVGKLEPNFDSLEHHYVVEVNHDVANIHFTGDSEVSSTSVVGLDQVHPLSYGENLITITATSNNGLVRHYYVRVIRPHSDYNDLESLIVKVNNKEVAYSPNFDRDVTTYTLNEGVPIGTEYVDLVVLSNGAQVIGDGRRLLVAGDNALDIEVISEAGNKKTYTVNVHRQVSDNKELIHLEPSAGQLVPHFQYGRTHYDLELDSSVNTLEFDVTLEDRFAQVSGHDREIVPSGISQRIIQVKAEDDSIKEYVITINKAATNVALLSHLEVNGYVFDQAFDPLRFEYVIDVPNSKKTLMAHDVVAKALDDNAKVSKMELLELETGAVDNIYEVKVTAIDQFTEQVYRIFVRRELGSDASIRSISFKDGGSLNRVFKSDELAYDLEFGANVPIFNASYIQEIITTDSKATLRYLNDEDIVVEQGKLKPFMVEVTSEDESEVLVYTFNVTYRRSSDNRLASLAIDGAIISPSFQDSIFEYDVRVEEYVTSIDIEALPRHIKAQIVSDLDDVRLVDLETEVQIMVVAENGNPMIYTLNVHRDLTHRVNLENISVETLTGESIALHPSFDDYYNQFEATISKDIDVVKLVVQQGHPSQVLTLYDQYGSALDLNEVHVYHVGKNKYRLNIKSDYQEERNISLSIIKEGNNNTYLKSLIIDEADETFVFDQDVYDYYVELDHTLDELTLTYEVDDPLSRAQVINNGNFKVGNNNVVIRVTSEMGTTRDYVIHVLRFDEYNNFLQNITVSEGGKIISDDELFFSPKFNPGILNYTVVIDSGYDRVTIEGIPAVDTTRVDGIASHVIAQAESGLGVEVQLDAGNNIIQLKTIPETGNSLIYNLNVVRSMNSAAILKDLSVHHEGVHLPFNEGDFDQHTLFYTIHVNPSVDAVDVIADKFYEQSTVQISGGNPIMDGENLIKVIVTSEDKKVSKAYYINVIKSLSSVNSLDSLSIKEPNKPAHTFDLSHDNFVYEVDSDVDSVYISGSLSDPLARVNGFGIHALAYGDNLKTITVTALNGDSKEYQILIKRAYNNDLASLTISHGQLSPHFDPKTKSYYVWVPLAVERFNVLGIAQNSPFSQVEGNGWYDLNVGENQITLKVTSSDASFSETTLIVDRSYSINTDIALLDVDQGLLSPSFRSDHYSYITKIQHDDTYVDLTLILDDPQASYQILGVDSQDVVINPSDSTRIRINNVYQLHTPLTIRVVAENGNTRDTSLTLSKQGQALYSNLLNNLTIKQVAPNQKALSLVPTFNPATNLYEVIVDSDATHVEISGARQHPDVTIDGLGIHEVVAGLNIYDVVVKNKDGVENVYKIKINQVASSDATLKNLLFDEGFLTPIFSRNHKGYQMSVMGSTQILTPTIVPYAMGTTYQISGGGFSEDLVVGDNEVVIDTLAQDQQTSDRYTVNVYKSNQSSIYLNNISANVGVFKEQFNKYYSGPYVLEIGENVHSVILNATPEDIHAIESIEIENDGFIDMTNQNYKLVEIKVNGKNNNSLTYSVAISRTLSDAIRLSYLSVNPGQLDPIFHPEVTSYQVSVDADVDMIEIKANMIGEGDISGIGIKALDFGVNHFEVIITSLTGDTSIYEISVERDTIKSSKIVDLAFNEVIIEQPAFDQDIMTYWLSVPYETKKLTLHHINFEDPVNTSYTLRQSDFVVGSNVVEVEAYNSVLEESSIYTFHVIRQEFSSNFLDYLSVNPGLIQPEFNKEHNNYDVYLPYEVDEIRISADPEDGNSSVTGIGLHRDLQVGVNELKVVVTSSQNEKRTYIVRAHRAQDSNTNILDLDVIHGTLETVQGAPYHNYIIHVDDVDEIEITGTLESPYASVVGLGPVAIINNEFEHKVIVTAQDGTSQVYTFSIRKERSSNAQVTNIYAHNETVNSLFTFDPDIHDYEINVSETIVQLGFEVITESNFAKVSGHENRSLSYGENIYEIKITSEDDSEENIYTFTINRHKGVQSITLNPASVVMNINEEKQLDLIIDPSEITDLAVTYTSSDNTIVSVDEHGMLFAHQPGVAKITVTANDYPELISKSYVEVLASLLIESDILDIERDIFDEATSDIPSYVIGSKDRLQVEEYIALFENEPTTLSVYSKDNELLETSSLVGTGMIIKLEINNIVYDELVIIVMGDANGDGEVDVADLVGLNQHLSGISVLSPKSLVAMDLNKDEFVDIADLVGLNQHLTNIKPIETNH